MMPYHGLSKLIHVKSFESYGTSLGFTYKLKVGSGI